MSTTHLIQFFFHGASIGEGVPVVVTTTRQPSGVRKGRKRELIVSLRDVESRESTAEFLKSQLRLRQGFTEPAAPPQPKETRAQRLARERKAALALRNMEIERAEEEKRALQAHNNAVISLLLIGSQ